VQAFVLPLIEHDWLNLSNDNMTHKDTTD